MTSESRPETEQGNSAGGGPATATSVNESKPAANAKDAFIGRVLEHYRLEERLGAGGMGLLYRATDLKLKRAVAVKLLARHLVSDETAKARFVQEARAASALDQVRQRLATPPFFVPGAATRKSQRPRALSGSLALSRECRTGPGVSNRDGHCGPARIL